MKFANVMPMAGKGERFLQKGYLIHKPFIKINKIPMFLEASKTFIKDDRYIFIYKKNKNKFLKHYNVKDLLPFEKLNKSRIINLIKPTKGQADTCLKALKYIGCRENIFIHSCDSYFEINKKKCFNYLKNYDVIIFTIKPKKIHLRKCNSYGWVHSKKNKITNIECKTKASELPMQDTVIIGSFIFKNKKILYEGIKSLYKKKLKVNNEYYLDMVIKECLKLNYKICQYNIKNISLFGTPEELKKYT